jgi:hypothetical protein
MFVVNPDSFLTPCFRISPFRTQDIVTNYNLQDDNFSDIYFDKKFGKDAWNYTINGREAINQALQYYNLNENDVVTILTTSGNFYISSCVTLEIEKFCKWNREITSDTKLIFVNHEFGYPYPDMESLVKLGLPIIEDCCTTFFSQDEMGMVGKYGDFSIYSFPKFFPIQIGGLLVSNKLQKRNQNSALGMDMIKYIQKVISHYLKNKDKLLLSRSEKFEYSVSLYTKVGFSLRFEYNDKNVPSLLILNNNSILKDLIGLKAFLSNNGIQSSVFFGEDAFFIPCHQNLCKVEIDYIFNCILNFKNQQI